jgi:hypothetical protein
MHPQVLLQLLLAVLLAQGDPIHCALHLSCCNQISASVSITLPTRKLFSFSSPLAKLMKYFLSREMAWKAARCEGSGSVEVLQHHHDAAAVVQDLVVTCAQHIPVEQCMSTLPPCPPHSQRRCGSARSGTCSGRCLAQRDEHEVYHLAELGARYSPGPSAGRKEREKIIRRGEERSV